MISVEHGNPDHNKWFVVNWCLGNTCTYKCSYCPTGLHDASIPWPDAQAVKSFILRMKMHAKALDKELYVELTGGEVTVWKHFVEVAEFCKSIKVKLGFISNGSRTLRWWQENKQFFDHVCLSFHPEFAEADHFISIVKELRLDLRTHVNIMMMPEKFTYCYEVAQKIKNIGNISMALQPLIVDFGSQLYEYSESQKRIFEKQHDLITAHIKWERSFDYYRGAMRRTEDDGSSSIWAAHRYINQGQNNWSGWSCYAGVEQIVVDMDGSIHRGWCKVGGSLGTIYKPKLTTEPVVCNKTMCHCNYDIMSTKVKDPDKAQRGRVIIPIREERSMPLK